MTNFCLVYNRHVRRIPIYKVIQGESCNLIWCLDTTKPNLFSSAATVSSGELVTSVVSSSRMVSKLIKDEAVDVVERLLGVLCMPCELLIKEKFTVSVSSQGLLRRPGPTLKNALQTVFLCILLTRVPTSAQGKVLACGHFSYTDHVLRLTQKNWDKPRTGLSLFFISLYFMKTSLVV